MDIKSILFLQHDFNLLELNFMIHFFNQIMTMLQKEEFN